MGEAQTSCSVFLTHGRSSIPTPLLHGSRPAKFSAVCRGVVAEIQCGSGDIASEPRPVLQTRRRLVIKIGGVCVNTGRRCFIQLPAVTKGF